MDNNFQNNEQYYQVSNEFTTENFENSNSESLLPQSEIKYTRDMEIIEVMATAHFYMELTIREQDDETVMAMRRQYRKHGTMPKEYLKKHKEKEKPTE